LAATKPAEARPTFGGQGSAPPASHSASTVNGSVFDIPPNIELGKAKLSAKFNGRIEREWVALECCFRKV
jgi:hypothetical protein